MEVKTLSVPTMAASAITGASHKVSQKAATRSESAFDECARSAIASARKRSSRPSLAEQGFVTAGFRPATRLPARLGGPSGAYAEDAGEPRGYDDEYIRNGEKED